jgi:hypothetical protein
MSKLSPDDLNDIARSAVNSIHGDRAPAAMTENERDEWRATADLLFESACQALSPNMDATTASHCAVTAVRESVAAYQSADARRIRTT